MPTNLTGSTIASTFDQLLHIDEGPTAEEKIVHSGTGVATALKLSTQSASVDNLRLDGNTISSTNTNGDIILTPNGTGEVTVSNINVLSGKVPFSTLTDVPPFCQPPCGGGGDSFQRVFGMFEVFGFRIYSGATYIPFSTSFQDNTGVHLSLDDNTKVIFDTAGVYDISCTVDAYYISYASHVYLRISNGDDHTTVYAITDYQVPNNISPQIKDIIYARTLVKFNQGNSIKIRVDNVVSAAFLDCNVRLIVNRIG